MTFNDLLQLMVERNASDLHLIAGLHSGDPRPRGARSARGQRTPDARVLKDLIYASLTPHQKNCFENDPASRNELDFGYGVPGRRAVPVQRPRPEGHDRRVRPGPGRPHPRDGRARPSGFRGEFTKAKRGLVLVTGPTGSGKSTTLASLIDAVNRTRADHIITIEDPIEYLHNSKKSYVTQREVGEPGDTLSFKNALKYALRQDPDVILIGEMRDYETIGIAITSAETGHLVFGTLHTSSAAQTVSRVVDVFPTDQQPQVRTQLASNLIGVVSQILLPRADGTGRVPGLRAHAGQRRPSATTSGRARSKPSPRPSRPPSAEGMQTMDQCLIKLCREGKIDYETAAPYLYEKSTHETIKALRR